MHSKRAGFSPLWLALIIGLIGVLALALSLSGKLGNQQPTEINPPGAAISEVSGSDEVNMIQAELDSSDIESIDDDLSPALLQAGF